MAMRVRVKQDHACNKKRNEEKIEMSDKQRFFKTSPPRQ